MWVFDVFVYFVILCNSQNSPLVDIVCFNPLCIDVEVSTLLSTNDELELLQMILSQTSGGMPIWVDCEIPRQLERGRKHFLQEYGNLSLADVF